ncbi:FAD-binding protein [Hoeflea alexandrii]|uniref:FAD-binding protein n=1 Tax=Hoeflea alexandrii TaxID=288436 RepID=UPI002D1E42EB|nr:FAD-binding protein [Hoeflea alexandrii]
MAAPFFAVKVTGALFHTQGGLMIDDQARVVREDGSAFANLFAGGGAACGVSGPDVSGYLSGNGLLTAIGFGFVAGDAAGTLAVPGASG